MRNLKVSFHHPNFIYGFKLDLHILETSNMLNVNPSEIKSSFQQITNILILSEQEKHLLQSLSISFRKAFIQSYNEVTTQRRDVDYIGSTTENHYNYFTSSLNHNQENLLLTLKWLYLYFKRNLHNNELHAFFKAQFISILLDLELKIFKEKTQQYEVRFYLFFILRVTLEARKISLNIETIFQYLVKELADLQTDYNRSHLTDLYLLFFKIIQTLIQKCQHKDIIHQILPKSETSILKFIVSLVDDENLSLVYESVTLILKILEDCKSMSELLMLITECIAGKIINSIEKANERVKYRLFQPERSISLTLREDTDLYARKRKSQFCDSKLSDKSWQKLMKKTYKNILELKERFSEFKSGRVKVKKKLQNKENASMKQEHKIKDDLTREDEIIQRLEQIRKKYQEEETRTSSEPMKFEELMKELNQLMKMNKWYEKKIQEKDHQIFQLQETISSFIDVKNQYNSKKKMKVEHKVINFQYSYEKYKLIEAKDSEKKPLPPPPSLSDLLAKQKQGKQSQVIPTNLPPLSLKNLPIPPIPPPLSLPQRNSQKRNSTHKTTKKEMKKILWNPVQISKVKDSFWQKVEELEFDQQKLINNFSRIQPQKKEESHEKKIVLKTMIQPERSKNIEIVLRKTKIPISQLESILDEIDEYFLTPNTVDSLLNIVPTTEELQDFISLDMEKPSEWTIADTFLSIASKYRNFQDFLKSIQFKYDFPELSTKYFININKFIQFFSSLLQDEFLQTFLQYYLKIGNYMNGDSSKGNIFGFRFQSIEKTYTLLGHEDNTTLFEFILKTMIERNYKLPENKYYSPSVVLPLQVLKQDLMEFKKHCSMVQQCILLSDEMEKYAQYFMVFYIEAKEQVSLMEGKVKQATKVYENVMDYYCQKLESGNLVRIVNEFRSRVGRYMQKSKKKVKY